GRDLKDFFKSGNDNGSKSGDREWFSVHNLRTLRYPNTAVTFAVGCGEVLGFAGLVGAGRSEVARAIFGIDATTEGRVTLGGQDLQISALIRKLSGEGVSVIAISSEMEEVLGISDRIAVMHEGRITGILHRPQFSEEAVMRLATGSAMVA